MSPGPGTRARRRPPGRGKPTGTAHIRPSFRRQRDSPTRGGPTTYEIARTTAPHWRTLGIGGTTTIAPRRRGCAQESGTATRRGLWWQLGWCRAETSQGCPSWGSGVPSARHARGGGETRRLGLGLAAARPFSSSPAPWPHRERRMRAAQRLPRPRRRAWPRLQSAVLRRQRRSRTGAAAVGRAPVRSRHGAQTRGWTLSHAIEPAAVRCSRRLDGLSPAGPQSASCPPARPHLGLAIPRASRSVRTAVHPLRSPSAPRVRAVVARPRRSRRRRRAAGFQSRLQAPDYQARRGRRELRRTGTSMRPPHPHPGREESPEKSNAGSKLEKAKCDSGSA